MHSRMMTFSHPGGIAPAQSGVVAQVQFQSVILPDISGI